jgi:hypothetical protein
MSALETLAEAAWLIDREIAGAPLPHPSWTTFKTNDPETAAIYQSQAASYLSALAAAGYAVVPVEPTEAMENACIRASMAYLALHALKSIWPWHNRRHVRGNIRTCYRAMLAAAGEPQA